MRKHKSIRVYSLVTTLLLTLLLSLLIGIVVAPKPDGPRKSVKTWDLKIRIGDSNEDDIFLKESVHQDEVGFYLFAEDVSCSGNLWDVPKKKGRRPNPSNYLSAQVDLFEPFDDCGTYQLPIDDLEPEDEDIVYVSIGHTVTPMGRDYWRFVIQWWVEIEPQVYKFFVLEAGTDPLSIEDWDPDPEGTLADEEGWLVEFIGDEGAEAILYSDLTDADNDGVPDNHIWRGPVSFTVKITRSPH